ncbi:unnamed protein product [Alternaria alternata]
MAMPLRPSAQAPSSRLQEIIPGSERIEELSDEELGSDYEDMGTATEEEQANIAYLESIRVPIKDSLVTETSETDYETAKNILPYLEGNPNDFSLNTFGIPNLQRPKHDDFLRGQLGDYPARAAGLDAARPWLLVPHTFSLAQHPDGGFGGGYGQYAHLACTYAAVLSLATVGGAQAYETINRKALWHFLGRMKQVDGGFTMCQGGEEDIRGAFCAMVVLSLTNLPLELPLMHRRGNKALPASQMVSAIGFRNANLGTAVSQQRLVTKPMEPTHSAAWGALLYSDHQRRHYTTRQCTPEGGYNGRTNKLVDGCYSQWVGGCWSIVEAATTTGLWNRGALGRYILAACQEKKGGLRDKPGKGPDAYHTCYNLAGLSAAQHKYVYDENVNKTLGTGNYGAPFHWKTEGRYDGEDVVWDEADALRAVHPVFVIPFMVVYETRKYFEDKEGF